MNMRPFHMYICIHMFVFLTHGVEIYPDHPDHFDQARKNLGLREIG
ncbi:hypothetical protein [Microcystis phage MJing1]|nr:hypothetical protein [Microcystis phage MJing1]